jgi:hypothetical protein
MMRRLACAAALLVCGCVKPQLPPLDPGLDGLALGEVHPGLILPGTSIDLVGTAFPDPSRGTMRLVLRGTFTAASGAAQAIDVAAPAVFVDATRLRAAADARFFAALPSGDGHFDGDAIVIVESALDGAAHPTHALPVSLDVATAVTPTFDSVGGGTMFVNGWVPVTGADFLLGGAEGETHAIVSGCFTQNGGTQCQSIVDTDVVVEPAAPWDRAHGQFVFTPSIAGIFPGSFRGDVRVENRAPGAAPVVAGSLPLDVALTPPAITSVSPGSASLGQYVDLAGGGFVGVEPDEVTLIHLVGNFQRTGVPQAAPVDLMLVGHFSSGSALRYVLDETDALGQIVDLRRIAGTFYGMATPIVRKGTAEVVGQGAEVTLAITPVKQVVYVRFAPSYLDSLRLYGLAAADAQVRARVLAVAARDYQGVNLEFRTSPPEDFALYSQVDVVGPDPNGLGLFGYDNTPGKDVGNERLFDRIGGVNATTQSDGFPGFGGIFAEQFFGFSRHPVSQVAMLPNVDEDTFDRIFDAVRPDTGVPLTAAEAAAGIAASDGTTCPAAANDRPGAVSCAVWVLGNLIGTTLTHEVGHSLGLADPTGELFHDPGDEPNRLMDSGDARPFAERAEIMSQGPSVFCDDEYVYLRTILAGASTSDPGVARPPCL